MITREQIVAEARTWIGTPFRHQGRIKGIGVDCIGVVIGVAHVLGLQVRDVEGYSRSPQGFTLLKELSEQGVRVDVALPGDVYLMRFREEPQHVAIATDCGLIHSYSAAGKCVEHGIDDYWQSRILGAFRWKELI